MANPSFHLLFLEFPVRFHTIEGFPSNGSMEIFNKGAWKPLCNANWDDVERTLVCQVQGYNGSSLEVDWQKEANSSENTPHSCEQLAQNCKDKIDREIKCSGIITFFCPQNGSRVTRMRIDTSIVMVVLTLSLKSLHLDDFQQTL